MKTLFIYANFFPSDPAWEGCYYEGVASLSAVLKAAGHETALLHVTRPFTSQEQFLEHVMVHDPQLIAFSSTTLTFKYVLVMAQWLSEAQLGIPVVSGGIHASLFPEEVIETPGIDMACVGEGEIPLRTLTEMLEKGQDFRKIHGLWVNDKDRIYANGVSPMNTDLNALPFPDRSIFDYRNLSHEKNGRAVFMASRGCPYHCSYCSNRILKQVLCEGKAGNYVRFKDVDNLLAEIKQVRTEYPFITFVHFDDDLFFLRKKWAAEFTEKYSSQVNLPFTCNIRPNHLNKEIVAFLKRAGCVSVKMGLESGNDWIRNKVLKRDLSDTQMYNAFKLCKDFGLKLHTFNMVGIPFETNSTILDTVKMNARAKSDIVQVSIFYPFPKTELYDICKKNGFASEDVGYDYYMPMLDIKSISKERIYFFRRNFKILVALYTKACAMKPPLNKISVSVLDKIFESSFCIDGLGWFLSLLRKAKKYAMAIRCLFQTTKKHAVAAK